MVSYAAFNICQSYVDLIHPRRLCATTCIPGCDLNTISSFEAGGLCSMPSSFCFIPLAIFPISLGVTASLRTIFGVGITKTWFLAQHRTWRAGDSFSATWQMLDVNKDVQVTQEKPAWLSFNSSSLNLDRCAWWYLQPYIMYLPSFSCMWIHTHARTQPCRVLTEER